jgi:DNA polymerase
LPFVGAAGKFLNEMLESAGLKREDVYITNIVKYRPPNNRDPLSDEKEAFWPFLLRQLEIIQPKIIATLGRHSMEYFLPGARVSEIHGRAKRINLENGQTVVIMPLFHPAAALYNGAMRETLMDDFAKLPSIVRRVKERDAVLSIMTG